MVAREHGYEALLASTDNDADREATFIATLQTRHCDGFVVASASRDDRAVRASGRADGLRGGRGQQ